MTFDAYERSVELLRMIAPLLRRLAGIDADLEEQMRRAATSCVLNISEGNRRVNQDRKNRFRIALGSAAEVGSCLDIAVALDYLDDAAVTGARELVDRVRAMTYRLTR